MDTPSDEELLRRAKKDPNQYQAIYDRYLPLLVRQCRRFLSDSHMAAAAAHDALTTGFLRLQELDENKSLKAWLFTVARHNCINEVRRYEGMVFLSRDFEKASLRDPAHDADAIARCLGKLSRLDQQIVLLRVQDDCTLKEIGASIRRSTSCVKKRYDQAIKKLQTCLRKNNNRS